jgi:hypothetical protein
MHLLHFLHRCYLRSLADPNRRTAAGPHPPPGLTTPLRPSGPLGYPRKRE